jgi:hypothetical protein
MLEDKIPPAAIFTVESELKEELPKTWGCSASGGDYRLRKNEGHNLPAAVRSPAQRSFARAAIFLLRGRADILIVPSRKRQRESQ